MKTPRENDAALSIVRADGTTWVGVIMPYNRLKRFWHGKTSSPLPYGGTRVNCIVRVKAVK